MSNMRGGSRGRDPDTRDRRNVLPDAPRRPGRRRGVRGLIATPAALRPPSAGAGGIAADPPRCRLAGLGAATVLATLLLGATGEATAASCAGVENRVNARTEELQGSVSAQITGVRDKLVAQGVAEQRALSSALAVLNRQESLTSEQSSTSLRKALEAATGVMVSQRQLLELKAQTDRYTATGYEPCALVMASRAAASRLADERAFAGTIQAAVRNQPGAGRSESSREAWFREFREGPPPTPDDLLSGDRDKAARWADFVMGPPDLPEGGSGAGTAALAVARAETDARRTAALEVMKAVAPPSPLQEVAGHWSGTDGGIAWSATMAAGDERSSKLDSIAIKAARAAIKARRLRIRLTLLMATAADAAARIDAGSQPQ